MFVVRRIERASAFINLGVTDVDEEPVINVDEEPEVEMVLGDFVRCEGLLLSAWTCLDNCMVETVL